MVSFSAPFCRFVLVAAFFISGHAQSATLQLANGDRLQGRLVSQAEGVIRWENPVLGVVTVPEAQAQIVPTTDTAAASPTAGTPPSASPVKPARDQAAAAARWKTTVESGLVLQSGRTDRSDVNLRAESTFERRRNSFRAVARYLYAKTDGTLSSDRTEAAFRWRRELSKHWFGQSNSTYYASRIKGIDHNVEQNLGLGYRLLKTERTTLSVGGGATGQYREIGDADTGHSLFGEVFQDFTIKLSPRLELGQDFTAQYSPSGRGIRILPSGSVQIIDTEVTNYKHTLHAYLRGKFTDTLSLSLRYEYEFDNTYVSESEKADQRITTSLGYSF